MNLNSETGMNQGVKRTVIALVLVAIGIYVAFIYMASTGNL